MGHLWAFGGSSVDCWLHDHFMTTSADLEPCIYHKVFCRSFLFILCIALFPYYRDSSGAILEVPSKSTIYKKDIDRIVMSYRCPIGVLWYPRNTKGINYQTSLLLVLGDLG